MSDMEDDFMCDDEEDYDLVFTAEFDFARSTVLPFCPLSTACHFTAGVAASVSCLANWLANIKLTAEGCLSFLAG